MFIKRFLIIVGICSSVLLHDARVCAMDPDIFAADPEWGFFPDEEDAAARSGDSLDAAFSDRVKDLFSFCLEDLKAVIEKQKANPFDILAHVREEFNTIMRWLIQDVEERASIDRQAELLVDLSSFEQSFFKLLCCVSHFDQPVSGECVGLKFDEEADVLERQLKVIIKKIDALVEPYDGSDHERLAGSDVNQSDSDDEVDFKSLARKARANKLKKHSTLKKRRHYKNVW